MFKGYPLITIGITCFNAEDTIERAIISAAQQDWPNVEIIVVDDCSTDNSLKIIENFQSTNAKVRIYRHEENLGYPSALNTIVKNAKGDYIAFFDDDDDNELDRLQKQYVKFTQFKEKKTDALVLCYSNRRVFVDGKEKPSGFVYAIGRHAPEPHGSAVADHLLWDSRKPGFVWGMFGSCTLFTERQLLRQFQFNSQLRRCAEWDLAIRVALVGGHFIAVDEPLVIQHKTQTSDKAGRKPLEYALQLRKNYKEYLQKNNVYWGAILQAYSRFYYCKGKVWKSRFCLALACLFSPSKIMVNEIAKRTR